MIQKNIPWSSEAEQSVIGALLLDNAAADRISDLRPDSFFDHANRTLYEAILALVSSNKPADIITVYERVQGKDNDLTLSYINALAQSVPSSSNIERYAKIIADRAKARALLSAGAAAMEAATDQDKPIDDRIEMVSAGLMRLLESTATQDATPLSELMLAHTQKIDDRANGNIRVIPTRIPDLDKFLGGGVRPGNVVIIGARPSMGKTALALTVALNMSKTHGVGILSMEMSKEELGDRTTSNLGRVRLDDVQAPPTSGQASEVFWSRVMAATEDASTLRLYIDDQGGLMLSQVRAKARAMKRKFGIDVLMVDYLQLMSGSDSKQSRTYQLEEITRGFKALAKELDIVIIALAQVLRRAVDRGDGMPGLVDLKDSGAIEQDADVVAFINRPILTNPNLGDEFKNFAKVFLAKNRQGPTGLLNMAFIGEEVRFGSWSGSEPAGSQAQSSNKKSGPLEF